MVTTYKEIAREAGLSESKSMVFCYFMKARFEDEEGKCRTGYAQEWAERFVSGREMEYADSWSRSVIADGYRYASNNLI